MPVYVRKSQQIPAPSWSEFQDDESDFVRDPDQFRDQLPQPYRLVDKILTLIVDSAWSLIDHNEEVRIKELSKVRPPQYECAIKIQLNGNASSLSHSSDGHFVFCGCDTGLVMVETLTQNVVCHWEQENVEITSIHVDVLAEQVYLLSTIDDMGIGRLFIAGGEKIYLIKVMNEQEGSSKSLCSKFESSVGGDYIGIAFENSDSTEQWLEFYKNPKDTWMKELETINPLAIKKSASTPVQEDPPPEIPEQQSVEQDDKQSAGNTSQRSSAKSDRKGSGSNSRKKSRKSSVTRSGRSRSTSPAEKSAEEMSTTQLTDEGTAPSGGNEEKPAHKFTAPTVILKVKAPTPITGGSASSAYQAMKGCDSGDVIGTGHGHFVSSHHLQQRDEAFSKHHEQFLAYLPPLDKPALLQASFKFLLPGRHLPAGLELSSLSGQPTSVAVWWTNSTQITHYSLIKQAKDLEHKPDLVWPMSASISSVAVSPCSSLFAVALTSGNITVWDRHQGISRGTLHMTDGDHIQLLMFVDPCICPQLTLSYPPYPPSPASYLMVTCDDSSIYLVNSNFNKRTPFQLVAQRIVNESERYSSVLPFHGLPELFVTVSYNGNVYLQDIIKGQILCQMVLPQGHELSSPWQPSVVSGGNGQMLYLKASCVSCDNEDNTTEPVSSKSVLFAFQTRSFPTLDQYRSQPHEHVPYMLHNTVDKRVEALFTYRLSQQAERQSRMQGRWYQLKNELFLIQQIRETKQKRAQISSAFTAHVH